MPWLDACEALEESLNFACKGSRIPCGPRNGTATIVTNISPQPGGQSNHFPAARTSDVTNGLETMPLQQRPRNSAALPLLFALFAPFAASDTHAWSRMADVEVRSRDGVPCFSITFKERWTNGVPLVRGISVYAYQAGRIPEDVWSFRLPLERRIKVDNSVCLPYGVAPDDATATPAAAPLLKPWQLYGVSLNGKTERASDSTIGYTGAFCLVPRDEGRVEVIDIPPGYRNQNETTCRGSIQQRP